MNSTLLNISGKIDSSTIAIYDTVSTIANQLAIPFVVVGASARDLVLHYGYGASIQRATVDVDFGIQVPDWQAFMLLKEKLVDKGYKETRAQQRLISPENMPIDILPFGQLEDEEANIQWPPDGHSTMNVLGFQEAFSSARVIRIQDDPELDIPVATPEGMVILKLIAWMDRPSDKRDKDAKDLIYLFNTYEKVPEINKGLYEDQELMEQYEWDIDLAGAHLLGINAKNIATDQTYKAIYELFMDQHESLTRGLLKEEMCVHIDSEYERNEELLNAFVDGFTQYKPSQ
ncbi:nucleotidyl transferase AbiEii/AbiGii toxin family protein [Motiliproteus sp. MSK22-1]|uniref:nucleotidyl transferase AbiEii/AbiGii toxin family protein n=1 Tax=Motiliproteus sp. MSK22-1 TaxID=1897630 RepID=UPI000978146F|nr:nucleotidyl transferase AbiEii/AbiGii toxin family protein [Motiliproteus sp. MSK22-1]OMH39407.1 hypothetical protein BGP75_03615 [Motiliproteus sp. MSK22-1]